MPLLQAGSHQLARYALAMTEDSAPKLKGRPEPPPVGKWAFYSSTRDPIPFGSPPDELVEVVGEVPWELRDDEPQKGPDGSGS